MVTWPWLVVAFVVGSWVGLTLTALIKAGGDDDDG